MSSIEIRKRATVSVEGHSDVRTSMSRLAVEVCEQAGRHAEEGVKIGNSLMCTHARTHTHAHANTCLLYMFTNCFVVYCSFLGRSGVTLPVYGAR